MSPDRNAWTEACSSLMIWKVIRSNARGLPQYFLFRTTVIWRPVVQESKTYGPVPTIPWTRSLKCLMPFASASSGSTSTFFW